MSLGSKSGCPQPNNENKSINPYVTVKGNILLSKCCGSEMSYRVSETKEGIDFDMSEFCPQCLDCCDTLEVKASDYDRDLYLDKNDNFNYESYDSKNYFLIPKCDSEVYTKEEYEIIKEARLNNLDITLDNNGDIYEIRSK
tara:strand:+ start:202 stop:624 length:423 start_codon:yes stop_codon:yes gene_type:complete